MFINKYTKRTYPPLLRKYGLEQDFPNLWKVGVHSAQIIGEMQEEDVVDYRLTGTWAQYCNMYKQETGKDHRYA